MKMTMMETVKMYLTARQGTRVGLNHTDPKHWVGYGTLRYSTVGDRPYLPMDMSVLPDLGSRQLTDIHAGMGYTTDWE